MKITRLFVTLLSVLTVLSLAGCIDSPKEFVAPVWDTQINLPVVDTLFKVKDILDPKDYDYVGLNPDPNQDVYFIYVNNLNKTSPIHDSLKIPGLAVPQGFSIKAPIPPGEYSSAFVYDPDPEFHLDTALFKNGAFKLALTNNSDQGIDCELIMPGFRSMNSGQLLSAKVALSPKSRQTVLLDFNGYRYAELPLGGNDPANYSKQPSQGFYIVTKLSSSTAKLVDFKTEISSDEILISRMVGKIKTIKFPYQEKYFNTGIKTDIGDFANRVDFKNVSLELMVKTLGEMRNIMVEDSLTVTGYMDENLSAPFKLLFNGKPYLVTDLIAGQPNKIILDGYNTNLIQFIKQMPRIIKVGSRFTLGGNTGAPQSSQVISSRDSVMLDMNIDAPLIVSVKDVEHIDTLKIDFENRDEILKANSAELTLELENHMGFGALASASFTDENYNTLFQIKNSKNGSISGTVEVDAANVNSEGVPTLPVSSKITLLVTKEDIQKFRLAKYVIARVALRSSGYSGGTNFGPFVKLRSNDYIKYKVYGKVNYHADFN